MKCRSLLAKTTELCHPNTHPHLSLFGHNPTAKATKALNVFAKKDQGLAQGRELREEDGRLITQTWIHRLTFPVLTPPHD